MVRHELNQHMDDMYSVHVQMTVPVTDRYVNRAYRVSCTRSYSEHRHGLKYMYIEHVATTQSFTGYKTGTFLVLLSIVPSLKCGSYLYRMN